LLKWYELIFFLSMACRYEKKSKTNPKDIKNINKRFFGIRAKSTATTIQREISQGEKTLSIRAAPSLLLSRELFFVIISIHSFTTMAPPKEFRPSFITMVTLQTTQFVDRCTYLWTQYLFTSIILLGLHNSFEKLTIVSLLEQLKKLLNFYFMYLFRFIRVRHSYILAQLQENDNLKGAMETILSNPQLNYVKFYVVTDLILQPQPSSSQPSCQQ